MPHGSFGEHHAVGEDGFLVEFSVAVAVFQAHDPVRLFRELFLDVVVGAGGVGDVEPPLVVKRGRDRPLDQWRTGDPLDREARGDGERATVELDFTGLSRESRFRRPAAGEIATSRPARKQRDRFMREPRRWV